MFMLVCIYQYQSSDGRKYSSWRFLPLSQKFQLYR